MKEQTVLILGGGVGGIVAAATLRKKLGKRHHVVLLDKKADFHFTPSYLWVITGSRTKNQICRPLASLSQKRAEFLQEEAQRIDPEKKVVQTEKAEVAYDYLIISLGADLSPESIPGYSAGAMYNLYDVNALPKIRESLLDIGSGSVLILIASSPFKCPAAPYEAALLADYILRKKGTRDKVSVSIFTPEPLPMPTAGPTMGNAVKQMVEARDIQFSPGHKVAKIDPKEKTVSFENQSKTTFDLLLVIPPHKAPKALDGSGLSGETGWIP
jgi:sulfide:quinone oxidoreductase